MRFEVNSIFCVEIIQDNPKIIFEKVDYPGLSWIILGKFHPVKCRMPQIISTNKHQIISQIISGLFAVRQNIPNSTNTPSGLFANNPDGLFWLFGEIIFLESSPRKIGKRERTSETLSSIGTP